MINNTLKYVTSSNILLRLFYAKYQELPSNTTYERIFIIIPTPSMHLHFRYWSKSFKSSMKKGGKKQEREQFYII